MQRPRSIGNAHWDVRWCVQRDSLPEKKKKKKKKTGDGENGMRSDVIHYQWAQEKCENEINAS